MGKETKKKRIYIGDFVFEGPADKKTRKQYSNMEMENMNHYTMKKHHIYLNKKKRKGILIALVLLFGMGYIFIKILDSRSDSFLVCLHENKLPMTKDILTLENPEPTQLMQELQQAYIQQRYWYYPWALDFSIHTGDERYQLRPEDLEQVTFYMDNTTGLIYFEPLSIQWVKGLGSEQQNKMFIFKISEIYSRRVITPQPDEIQYCIYSVDVTDIRERLINLGTAEMEFPDEETIARENRADNKMTENEYTQAVKDMVHGTLLENERYGMYQIYIGEYLMTDDTGIYSEQLGKTAVEISAAVVCEDDGYGYFCRFLASDLLEDGKVKIYYQLSDTVNMWEENIKQAMCDKRLVLSIEVKPGDEIEIPVNPYPFVMIPILDYATGDGLYPEWAIYGDDSIFY